MTVVLRHNETLELNLVEYAGAVTPAELRSIEGFGAKHPDFLKTDALNIVHRGAHFAAVDLGVLDALFAGYRKLYKPLDFQIYRRAAWLCFSAAAAAHVEYWVGTRDLRESMSSAVRKFETFAEAGDWLLLSEAELATVRAGEGFVELARFDLGAAPAVARRA